MQEMKRQHQPTASAARAITRGPGHHWFGYYDKWQVDPTGRYALCMRAGFEGRQPRADDEITIGMIDLEDGDRWIDLGRSRAWCWQQGCMLQWIPGSRTEVVWNDREDGRFVSRILDVASGARRTLPMPIYTLSPDGRTALTLDFSRLDVMRPGYGYAGVPDPCEDEAAPGRSGIWSVDLATDAPRLILSLAQLARIPWLEPELGGRKSWFNVPIFSPSGKRFLVLNRCWREDGNGLGTRMLTAAADGSDLRIVDPFGHTSHLVWRDDATIIAWTRVPGRPEGFFLFDERTGAHGPIGQAAMPQNGHVTYVPGTRNEWILNDTYPQGPRRLQELYLYHAPSGRRVDLGAFPSPPGYDGAWRCDLHPRTSQDGRRVYIDSAHGGGRQIYEIDIGPVVG
jgi:hypothetical protein